MSPESLVAFILILGVLVAFHEFGHMIAAKMSGMKVEEFAFGFGPRLVRLFKRRETEYTIHAVPLGGFVKILGMEPGEEDIPDGFQAQAVWKRALVIFAGPLFSFILGAGVLLFVGLHWGFPNYAKLLPVVGSVDPKTEAARIDLRAGDRVLEIDGVKITRGSQMTDIIHKRPGRPVTILIERNGRELPVKTARPRWLIAYLGVSWSFMKGNQASVGVVDPASQAAGAGIEQGDKLVAINGRNIDSGPEMTRAIEQAGDEETQLTLERQGRKVAVKVKPAVQWVSLGGVKWTFPGGEAVAEEGGKPESGARPDDVLRSIDGRKVKTGAEALEAVEAAKGRPLTLTVSRTDAENPVALGPVMAPAQPVFGRYTAIGLLGFMPAPKLEKADFATSIKQGLGIIGRMIQLLAETLTSKKIKTDVGGPIMIAKVTESSLALGPYWVLVELGSLSLSLAIINLVPIPAILDGGHLILLAIEAVRRKRWTRSQMAAMQVAGITLIGILFILIFVSDIMKIVTGQVPQ